MGKGKILSRWRNCARETEGRACFKTSKQFYVTRAEGLGKTTERQNALGLRYDCAGFVCRKELEFSSKGNWAIVEVTPVWVNAATS